jgi:membrane-bound lytic murein transglycosylase A
MKLRRIYTYKPLILFAFLLTVLFAGCAVRKVPPTRQTALKRVYWFARPQFADDLYYEGLERSLQQSISYLQGVPSTKTFRFGEDVYDTAHMLKSLEHFLRFIQTKPSQKVLKKHIAANFRIYTSVGRDYSKEVLFTGYYEPFLEGSLEKSDEYRFPVYGRPKDLLTINLSRFSSKYKGEKIVGRYTNQTVVPYFDRKEIESENFLIENAPQIAWVKDPIDLFFLHVQGSGKILLDSGETINVHYHDTNGRPYRSIGKLLIDEGKIPREEMSMQSIRAYLREHPEEIETVLNYNPSYVFFKIEPEGPLGFLGVELTPERSIALDRRLFPRAGLAFIEVQKPVVGVDGRIQFWADCRRFVLNQDTGGAIRGPGRADLFWGNGAYAETAAGHMQHPGRLYFLILKPG